MNGNANGHKCQMIICHYGNKHCHFLSNTNGNNNGHSGNDHGHSLQMLMAIYGHYKMAINKMATIAIIPIMAIIKGQL